METCLKIVAHCGYNLRKSQIEIGRKGILIVKRIMMLLLMALLCCMLAGGAYAENGVTVHCDQQGFSLTIPGDKTATWEENTGYQVFVEHAGYIPYVIVYRRTLENKFKNPVNYLNNTYREYMEDQYSNVGTNPCKKSEIGGKSLYGASYHYEVNGTKLVLRVMIEQREDGDVEYSAKYIEGKGDATLSLLDTIVATYQPDGAKTEDTKTGDTKAENTRTHNTELFKSVESLLEASKQQEPEPEPKSDLLSSVEKLLNAQNAGSTKDVQSSQRTEEIVEPRSVSSDVNTTNGVYWVRIDDAEKIYEGGFFTASLYLQDIYDANKIESLHSGSQVRVNGIAYTVSSVVDHGEDGIEIYTEEEIDGYLVFKKEISGYLAVMNDWTAATHMNDFKVMMPLPYNFSFAWISGGGEAEVYDADGFVSLMTNSEAAPTLNQYNTMISFQDGLAMMIIHTDYPLGPDA